MSSLIKERERLEYKIYYLYLLFIVVFIHVYIIGSDIQDTSCHLVQFPLFPTNPVPNQ